MELAPLFLRHDSGRALRVAVVFGGALMICHALGRRNEAVFVAMAAQAIALPDLRGAYGMRLAILGTMIFTITVAAALGTLVGESVFFSTVAMGAIALSSGGWRHLSADYGPALGISSALLFLIGIAYPAGTPETLHRAALVFMGGSGATLFHVLFWPFRPHHPLRFAVAESWVALADLIDSMRPSPNGKTHEVITGYERELRATLDRTFVILGAVKGHRHTALLLHLEAMRREAVHLAVRAMAFNTVLEELNGKPEFASIIPVTDSMLKTLGDASRSTAITLITHRSENFAASALRLRRCGDLIRVLDEQLASIPASSILLQIQGALGSIEQALPQIRARLEETLDPGSAPITFPARLPELGGRSARTLSAWINRAPQLDPVLVRYAMRMALLTMLAVALYKGLVIPRGYWIVFTIVVVLQPDYGSTRLRAGQRIGGTLAGSLLGSLFIWIPMPLYLLDCCAAIMAFLFAYFLRSRYGLAVFFVTLLLVLMTETMAPVGLDFTVQRLAATVLGGAVALASALIFWPVWEREKFTALLAAAIRSNRIYLETLVAQTAPETEEWLMVKRRAENANRFAAASLQRLLGEPNRRHENPQRSATLTAYNQRLTRALSAMAVHRHDGLQESPQIGPSAASDLSEALETLAHAVETDFTETATAEATVRAMRLKNVVSDNYLAKSIVEIRAMAFALASRPAENEFKSPGTHFSAVERGPQ
ncbi:MAG: hypothetical protein JWL90_4430 [Chthoniobacteraceae bacterium]|nr:hypothetical protein [Chthoniobacteraceae bacterium]